LGLATLAARDKPATLRTMVAASAAVDTDDTAISLGLATASPGARRPAIAWTLVGNPLQRARLANPRWSIGILPATRRRS